MPRGVLVGGHFTPANPSLEFPVRAIHYFPWFDEGWEGIQAQTHYTPSLGFYDQNDPDVIQTHLAAIKGAGFDALICVWRGPESGSTISTTTFGDDSYNTDPKLGVILDQCLQWGLKACILYEIEAYADPSAAEVEAEFDYLEANHWNHPAWLKVDDRPVVFVFTNANATNAMSQKYSDATAGFTTAYVMLQTMAASSVTPMPDGLYRFHSTRAESVDNSYSICPGFWRGDLDDPTTTRDLATWTTNVADMVASGKDWNLVISWNEWGEGSQLESSDELGTTYLEVVADA